MNEQQLWNLALFSVKPHKPRAIHPTRAAKIKEIEEEFGMDFEDVLRDFAKEHSFNFTTQTLGLNHKTYREYRKLFKHNKRPAGVRRPEMTERNLRNAPLYDGKPAREWAEITGLSQNTILYRVRNGIPINAPKMRQGDVTRFKGKRDNSTWVKMINDDCERSMNK